MLGWASRDRTADLRGNSHSKLHALSVTTKEMEQAGRLFYLHTLNLNSSTSPSLTT